MKEPISTKIGKLLGKALKSSFRITKNIGKGVIKEFKGDKKTKKK